MSPFHFKWRRLSFFLTFFLCNVTHFSSYAFDSTLTYIVIDTIAIDGNHKTKDFIITRELSFKQGDTILMAEAAAIFERSRQNIYNTALFNFSTIDYFPYFKTNGVRVNIDVVERWYIWPIPLLEVAETNFNTWWINKDLSRVNYGMYVLHENFRGRKETLKLRLRLGFDEQLALQYMIPYANQKQTIGLGFTGGYSRNHTMVYGTENGKRLFHSSQNEYGRTEAFTRGTLTYRPNLYNTILFESQYTNVKVSDSLRTISNQFLKNNSSASSFITLKYQASRDKRDLISYPLKGYFASILFVKHGLGILNNDGLNLFNTYVTLNSHLPLTERFYYGQSMKLKLSFLDQPPYHIQRGFGFQNNFIRGYEYYVIDGQSYSLFKSNFKYQLIKPHSGTLSFVPVESINQYHFAVYLNWFFDAGYMIDDLYKDQNPLANTWQYGSGLGLDIVTYYDQVMRIEFSVNRLNEKGIFLHFLKPI